MQNTFVVYVEDKPGVLNRISSLLRRRNFNIESLTVGHTDKPGVSRMTLSWNRRAQVAAHRSPSLQARQRAARREHHQLNVGGDRDLAMIKVLRLRANPPAHVMQLVDVFRGRIVDVTSDSPIVEITGTEDKIDGLLEVLRPYGVLEMVRTGRVAMSRGLRSATARTDAARIAEDDHNVFHSV